MLYQQSIFIRHNFSNEMPDTTSNSNLNCHLLVVQVGQDLAYHNCITQGISLNIWGKSVKNGSHLQMQKLRRKETKY